jgi:hypothetical protein
VVPRKLYRIMYRIFREMRSHSAAMTGKGTLPSLVSGAGVAEFECYVRVIQMTGGVGVTIPSRQTDILLLSRIDFNPSLSFLTDNIFIFIV